MSRVANVSNVCYLKAALVGTPAGTLAELALCGRGGTMLGALDGILIDPATGRFSHLVVKSPSPDDDWRKAIPLDALVRMTRESGRLRLEIDADALDESEVDLDAVPPLSDEDVKDPGFGRHQHAPAG